MSATEKVISSTIKKVPTLKNIYNSDDSDNENLNDQPEDKTESFEEVEEIQEFVSMNNPQYYGEIIVNIDFSEAIENGYISDYRFVCVNSGDPVEVIKKSITELNIQHMITYHSTVKGAKELSDKLNVNGIKSFTIDGTMSSKIRKEILKQFEENHNCVLTSCKVLSEGVSLNFVDCVYFIDPKHSKIDIIQSFCRCLRLHKDKTLATIIIENNIDKYADVLKNIVILDKRLKSNKYKYFINIGFSKEEITKNKEELNYIIIGRNEAKWEKMYNYCVSYEQESGNKIKNSLTYKDVKLGEWMHTTKKNYKGIGNRLLTDEEKSKLSNIRTFKEWLETGGNTKVKNEWDTKYALCLEYQQLVNKKILYHTEYKGYKIGRWIHYFKSNLKGTGRRNITPKEIELLMKIDTFRNWIESGQTVKLVDKWNVNFQYCLDYEKNTGNLINTSAVNGTIYNYKNLGSWFSTVKACYKGKGSRLLTNEEKEKLKLLNTFNKWLSNQ